MFSFGKRLVGDKEKAEERKGMRLNNSNVINFKKMGSLPVGFLCSGLPVWITSEGYFCAKNEFLVKLKFRAPCVI